jgi:hypothetical protein
MHVLGQRPERGLAVAPAHADQRQFALEADEAFEDRGTPPRASYAPATSVGDVEPALAAAVVAEPARLQDRRQADSAHRRLQSRCESTAANGAVGIPSERNSAFRRAGPVRRRAPSAGDRTGLLRPPPRLRPAGTFSTSKVTTSTEAASAASAAGSSKRPGNDAADLRAGRILVGVDEHEALAERIAGQGQHASELAAPMMPIFIRALGTAGSARPAPCGLLGAVVLQRGAGFPGGRRRRSRPRAGPH